MKVIEDKCPTYQLIPGGTEEYFTAMMLKVSYFTVRSTRKGNVFSLSVHREGTPPSWSLIPGPFWAVPPGLCPSPAQEVTSARTGPLRPGQGVKPPAPPPSRQESKCCYAAGGKPLAVTQEDFLVLILLAILLLNYKYAVFPG